MTEYRCDERLKTKKEESTRLSDTGLVVELEHLKTTFYFLQVRAGQLSEVNSDPDDLAVMVSIMINITRTSPPSKIS